MAHTLVPEHSESATGMARFGGPVLLAAVAVAAVLALAAVLPRAEAAVAAIDLGSEWLKVV
jgi:hypothetical protein